MDRVTIFGAGHVGATTAFYLTLQAGLELVLVDVEEGRAEGLALDIGQSLPFAGSSSTVMGGSDPDLVEGSQLVVITAGSPRLPGMSRTDLTDKNRQVVAPLAARSARLAPDAPIINVTNPVDEMTYLAWQASGLPPERVMGMAGVLDTSRFLYFLNDMAGLPLDRLRAMVLGSHGDEMVSLVDWSHLDDEALSDKLAGDDLTAVVERTRNGGGEIVAHYKTGSAYFAPAVSISVMALAILGDTGRVLPVTAYLTGQYGIDGIFLGVPARLAAGGVAEVLEVPLSERENGELQAAAARVRKSVESLGKVGSADA